MAYLGKTQLTIVIVAPPKPVVLGNPTVIPGVGVTHLRYPVRKA
jgi:hypothetical protein